MSGLLWGGTPGRLLSTDTAGRLELYSSAVLIAELRKTIGLDKFSRRLQRIEQTAPSLVASYLSLVTICDPAVIPPTILRDPDDDHVLAATSGAGVDLIVSGDAHLLDLGRFGMIEILSPRVAVDRLF